MDFFKVIEKRRSVRKYRRQPVEPEKIALIIETALRAPSSRGRNTWEFIVVDDHNIIRELSNAKQSGSSFLKGAPLALVVCANPDKSDMWIENASIASIFISLAAEAQGLGSCWIQIRDRRHNAEKVAEEFVKEELKIPSDLRVESIIAVGYPDEQKPAHKKEELQYEKVFNNVYKKNGKI